MSYYDAILTSIISVDTLTGTLLLLSNNRVLLQEVGEQYVLLGYYTHSGNLVLTLPQHIDGSILDEITPTLYDMSELSEAPGPQGLLDDQMLELPEDIPVPDDPGPQGPRVPEPEGLYRFRNIQLRL